MQTFEEKGGKVLATDEIATFVEKNEGERVILRTLTGDAIANVEVGLNWNNKAGNDVDLDLFVVSAAEKKTAYFGSRTDATGEIDGLDMFNTCIKGVQLSNDDTVGDKGAMDEKDNELALLNAADTEDGNIFICVNIYKDYNFGDISEARLRVKNADTKEIIVEVNLTEGAQNNGLIVGKLEDKGDYYEFVNISRYTEGSIKTISNALAAGTFA